MLVFNTISEKDIVAFKHKDGEWFTGKVSELIKPEGKYNEKNKDWHIRIDLNVPIEPQWGEDEDLRIVYREDVKEVTLLEKCP